MNFENERLVGIVASDLDNLLIAHKELFNPDGTIYLFLMKFRLLKTGINGLEKSMTRENIELL